MNKILAIFLMALGLCIVLPATGQARVFVGVGIGGGGYGYGGGYYPGYYGGYYPGYYGYPYYAPPAVVYTPPPVVYAPPAATVYEQAPTPVSTPVDNQPAPVTTGDQGQTCRTYDSTAKIDGATAHTTGTACLQPDGTWKIVR